LSLDETFFPVPCSYCPEGQWLFLRAAASSDTCRLRAETSQAAAPSKLVMSFRSAFWTGALDLGAHHGGTFWGESMKRFLKISCFGVLLCGLAPLGPANIALAQRPGANAAAAKATGKAGPGAYDISKDVSLQGSVLKYTENSPTPPVGPHVLLQTSSGNVDVHLGDAKVLRAARMNFAQGTSVRFIGQTRTVGQATIFLARLVQIGSQLVAVRSDHAVPVAPANLRANRAVRAKAQANQQGGAR